MRATFNFSLVFFKIVVGDRFFMVMRIAFWRRCLIVDDGTAIIEPRRGKREAPLPPLAMLIFTPHDLALFFRCFSTPPQRSQKHFLVDVYTGVYGGTEVVVAGPMLGAPQSILVLEKLIALGVSDVVAVGWCGSLQSDVRIGDVVLPRGAVSEEGTSAHYPIPKDLSPGPSSDIFSRLQNAFQSELLTVHEGKVWSTDAPYRETAGKIRSYQGQGVLAVDMETSALFTVACFRNIRLTVALVVSDELSSLSWTHGFKNARFKEAREKLVDPTLKVMCSSMETASRGLRK